MQEVPLSMPDIQESDIELVVRTLGSGRLSIGSMQARFEEMVAAVAGVRNGVACSSGTAGLHMLLAAMGVGPGDEVITTPFSFIASANCILYVGATPVFVDIDPKSLNMDPEKVEAAITPRTKAIIAVEAFGNPAHMEAYRRIADRHEIKMIEDSCEALGCSVGERRAGSFGHAGVFGFYPNKQITTGEGGMVVTNDDRLASVCRSLRNQGRADEMGASGGSWLSHERLGFNYRLDELSAALGVAQMTRLESMLSRRRQIAEAYMRRLMVNPDLILPTIADDVRMSWFVFVVRLNDQYSGEERDRIIAGMRRHDVGAAPYFPCIHLQPFYRERFGFSPGMFPIAETVSQRTIALPFFTRLSGEDGEFAASTLELMIGRESLRRG